MEREHLKKIAPRPTAANGFIGQHNALGNLARLKREHARTAQKRDHNYRQQPAPQHAANGHKNPARRDAAQTKDKRADQNRQHIDQEKRENRLQNPRCHILLVLGFSICFSGIGKSQIRQHILVSRHQLQRTLIRQNRTAQLPVLKIGIAQIVIHLAIVEALGNNALVG